MPWKAVYKFSELAARESEPPTAKRIDLDFQLTKNRRFLEPMPSSIGHRVRTVRLIDVVQALFSQSDFGGLEQMF